MNRRLLPGDGDVDFGALLGRMDTMGVDPFIAVEIFNPSIVAERGVQPAADAMRQAAERVVAGTAFAT